MAKREEWEKMIECVENDSVSKDEILRFLKNNQPKPKESRKRLPCTCGNKETWFSWSIKECKWFIKCCKCNKQAEGSRFQIQAIRNWNELIKSERRESNANR